MLEHTWQAVSSQSIECGTVVTILCTMYLKTDEVHSAQVRRALCIRFPDKAPSWNALGLRIGPGLGENRYALRQSNVNLIHSGAINCSCVGFRKTFAGQHIYIFLGGCYWSPCCVLDSSNILLYPLGDYLILYLIFLSVIPVVDVCQHRTVVLLSWICHPILVYEVWQKKYSECLN